MIDGGRPLRGSVRVNGSKNSALPILIASLLTDEECRVANVPRLRDINTTFRLLEVLGKRLSVSGHSVSIRASGALRTKAPYDLVKQMRASVLVAGPLLARRGQVRVALPGGCAIGLRPIDIHLKAFEEMGAQVRTERGDVVITGRLKPARVRFKFPSVGATENVMTAAAAVPGTTVIENAAREPEIEDLADFLNKMGARVEGAGGPRVRVRGAERLRGVRHRVIPDRVEAGTFLIACAAAGGDVTLEDARPEHLKALLAALRKAGAVVLKEDRALRLRAIGRPRAVSIRTEPHPGFPTDLQAPWMAYMSLAKGSSRVREDIFERRFLHAAELGRMGADVSVDGESALVRGVPRLTGAPVMASDIRAGAALVVAALAAKGPSVIQRVYHIDRGYEHIESRLRRLGARVRRAR